MNLLTEDQRTDLAYAVQHSSRHELNDAMATRITAALMITPAGTPLTADLTDTDEETAEGIDLITLALDYFGLDR